MSDKDYLNFIELVKSCFGIDLALYKEAQMKRRLTSLREKRGYRDFHSYFDAIIVNKDLKNEFLDRITINVSEFYRNPVRWQYLQNTLLPQLLSTTQRPRFWSAACSTGEEPYTLALILTNYLRLDQIDILATDIDENVLKKASEGIYQERTVKDVPSDLLQKHFHTDGELYRINKEIKDRITFKRHNLLSDSFMGPYDLIICRNVMIYFTDEAKEDLYYKFSQALRPGGLFFVGSTEQIFQPQKYNLESVASFFYRRLP